MYQALLTDVEKSAARAAMPGGGLSAADVLLETIKVRKREKGGLEFPEAVVDGLLFRGQRLELTRVVVQDAYRAREAEFTRSLPHPECIFGVPDARAQHRIDGDAEFGRLGQPLQLSIQYLQRLLRDLVRQHVIDADLQVV